MGQTDRRGQVSRMCWQGVCQIQEREQWQWHTILRRSSLGHRCHIQGFKKPEPRSQTPSGGKGGQPKQCDRCGKCNAVRVRREHRECGFCNGKNHYRAVCRKAASVQKGGGAQPQQKQGKGKSPGKSTGKPKAKYAHSVVLKTVP